MAIYLGLALVLGACGSDDGEVAATPTPTPTPSPSVEDPAPAVCTRVGCGGAVIIGLRDVPPAATRGEVCVDGHCEPVRAPLTDEIRVAMPAQDGEAGARSRTAPVSVVLRAAGGSVVARGSARVRLTAYRPNGPGCDPTCWSGRGTVELERR